MIGLTESTAGVRRTVRPRFVQTVVSPRARGLSVRLNLAPSGDCNFKCAYCEVNRDCLRHERVPDIPVMMAELEAALDLIGSGRARQIPDCADAPEGYLNLGHVALSGDGEPTLCPCFAEILESLLHLRAGGRHGFFHIAVVTNSSRLGAPEIRESLSLLTPRDEIWAKLDAGSEAWFRRVNNADITLAQVMENLKTCGKEHELIIQSLFPSLPSHPTGPPAEEISEYINRLNELKADGVRIRLVQVYSTSRKPADPGCGHLSLAILSGIARQVRARTGLNAQVY